MAKILAHRGLWGEGRIQNSVEAVQAAFDAGFGVETDLRDDNGQLVVAHDVDDSPLSIDLFSSAFKLAGDLPVAINVKADGLAGLIGNNRDLNELTSKFVFDMSVPDMRSYFQTNIPVFGRLSEEEPVPAFADQLSGIWLDAFRGEWYTEDIVASLLSSGKTVTVVSPELHGRDHLALWKMINRFQARPNLFICTDYPWELKYYFARNGGAHD